MSPEVFERRSLLPVTARDAYAWHARPGALPRLSPPWAEIAVVDPGPGIDDGTRVVLRVKTGPFLQRWVAEHRSVVRGAQFRDVQVEGPFRTWDHLHRFEPADEATSWLEDRIEYALPAHARLGHGFVRRTLERTFAWRHATTQADLATWQRYRDEPRLRVLVTGASGLVGRQLSAFLTTQGHEVVPLVRGPVRENAATWDPSRGAIDLSHAGALDAVVHLAGANVAKGRWTDARKRVLIDSRVEGTKLLVGALAKLEPRPRVLVSASGTGFFGDRGDALLTEDDARGEGFLADLAVEWEGAARAAEAHGLRTVQLRLGLVLTPAGGGLPRLVSPTRVFFGGPLGSGGQYWPWVSIDDVLDGVMASLVDDRLSGPVNLVAPEAVTNRTFARTLGAVLHRPAFLPAPAFALRLLLGEMADDMLLASQRVEPKRLLAIRHPFRHPTLASALRHVLGRPA